MTAPTGIRPKTSRQHSAKPTFVAEAMQLTRSGRPREALRLLEDHSGNTLGMGDTAAAMVLAQLSSTASNRLALATQAFERIPSDTPSALQQLASAHLQLVRGELSRASATLLRCVSTAQGADDGISVDACLLGARIALIRDDYEEAQEILASGNKKLAAASPAERTRLETYSLMFGVEFQKQLSQAQKWMGLAERFGPLSTQLLAQQTPSTSAGDTTNQTSAQALTRITPQWQTQLLGGSGNSEAALLLWGAAHGLGSAQGLSGNLAALTPLLSQLAEVEPLLNRSYAQLRLSDEREAMGFAGDILHALLASRTEQSFQRTLALSARYPDALDIELLLARYAAHVGHQPLDELAERIAETPNDLRWLELGIEVALEVGDAGYAQRWAATAWNLCPGARTGGWLVRAAQVAQADWTPLRQYCEQALGFLGSSTQAPFAMGHAMKLPVQLIYADALIGTGDAGRAKGLLLQVLQDAPQAIEAYLRLGQAEIQLGDMVAADAHLTRYLEDGRGLNHPLAAQARLDRAHVRVLRDLPRAARDDLRAISPNQVARYEEGLARVPDLDGLIAISDMGVRAHVTLADLRNMVATVEPREVDLTLREHAKRPQNRENAEFLTLLAKNNYRMGKTHDGMVKDLASRAILIALAEGREAIEAAQILLDVNRRNPSFFRMIWAAISSVMSWFSSTVVNTGAP